jgi:hypothetical protein
MSVAGSPPGEISNLKDAMRPLRTLHGTTPAEVFGPKALKAVHEFMRLPAIGGLW